MFLTTISIIFSAVLSLSPILTIPVGAVLAGFSGQTASASSDTQRGIELYQQGKIKDAIKVLERATEANADDGDAWHFLGLACVKADRYYDARIAFTRAVRLRPSFAPSHLNLASLFLLSNDLDQVQSEAVTTLSLDPGNPVAHYLLGAIALRRDQPNMAKQEAEFALGSDPGFGDALLLKSLSAAELGLNSGISGLLESPEPRRFHLQEAITTLSTYLRLNTDEKNAAFWQAQLDGLRKYRDRENGQNGNEADKVYLAFQVTTHLRVNDKPAPFYPEESRKAMESGMVRLRAVFSAAGNITDIIVIRPLSLRLTESAISALKGVKFTPATLNGRAVSQIVIIEYNFVNF